MSEPAEQPQASSTALHSSAARADDAGSQQSLENPDSSSQHSGMESRNLTRYHDQSDEAISNSEAEDSSISRKRARSEQASGSVDDSDHQIASAPKRRATNSRWDDEDEKERRKEKKKSRSDASSGFKLDRAALAKVNELARRKSEQDAAFVGPAKPATPEVQAFNLLAYNFEDDEAAAELAPVVTRGSFLLPEDYADETEEPAPAPAPAREAALQGPAKPQDDNDAYPSYPEEPAFQGPAKPLNDDAEDAYPAYPDASDFQGPAKPQDNDEDAYAAYADASAFPGPAKPRDDDDEAESSYLPYPEDLPEPAEEPQSGAARAPEQAPPRPQPAQQIAAARPKPISRPSKPTYGNYFTGCRLADDAYERVKKIGDGTYGTVYKARDLITGELVALKKVKMDNEKEGFPLISFREIKSLMGSEHPNIVSAREVVVGPDGDSYFIVMEYLEHDLHSLMEDKGSPFTLAEIKSLMHQLISAVDYMHQHWSIHRDIKTSNLLYSNKGVLKLCDFGLARDFYSPVRQMTPTVVTLWYRAPEVLLGMPEYTEAIDMWSVGCIFAELLDNKPVFCGNGEIDQLRKIFAVLGAPNETIWPQGMAWLKKNNMAISDNQKYSYLKQRYAHLSPHGYDLLQRMLTYDPQKRITAAEALKHPWFTERPLPKDPHMMPTFPSRFDGGKPPSRQNPSEPPMDVQQSVMLQHQQHIFGANDRHYER